MSSTKHSRHLIRWRTGGSTKSRGNTDSGGTGEKREKELGWTFTAHPPSSRHFVHCSGARLCLSLWSPVDCSIPGFPVLHCLLEFAQTHGRRVSNAIQPAHPLLPPSPPAGTLLGSYNISFILRTPQDRERFINETVFPVL